MVSLTFTSKIQVRKCYRVTNASIGLTTLAMWYTGAYRAMWLAGVVKLLLAVSDGFVASDLVHE